MKLDFAKLLANVKAEKEEAYQHPVSQPQNAVPLVPASVSSSSPETSVAEKKDSTAAISSASASDAGAVVQYPGLHELRDRIYALDKALLEKHPAMDSLLQSIHRNLSKDPELVHLLSSEERAMIFKGLKQKTQTVIVEETVKSAGSGKNKGLKNITLEDM